MTSLRFFAALLVVVHHGTLELARLPVVAPLSVLGYVGVTFFFILSGFVLTWSASPDLPKRYFYGRRLARISPTHLVTLVIAVAVSAVIGLRVGAGPLIANATLTHAWVPTAPFTERLNSVSWSLVSEAFFYALFPFLFMRWHRLEPRQVWHRVGIVMVLTLACAALIHQMMDPRVAGDIIYKFPAMRVGEFLIGTALALAMRRGWRCPVSLGTAIVVAGGAYVGLSAALAMAGHSGMTRVVPNFVMIVPFAILIASAATTDLDPRVRSRGLTRGSLILLGQASYQLYMIHYLMVISLRSSFARLDGLSVAFALVGFVGVSVAISVVAYRLFEVPTERWLRARMGGVAATRGRARTLG